MKSPEDSQEWISIFNGKNLDGWTPKIRGYKLGENFGNTFRVEDGKLCVNYDQYDEFGRRFGHLFYKTEFSHYVIRLEYRFLEKQVPGGPGWAKRNSGIMVHGQSPESMRKDQDFPVSIEVQLLGGVGDDPRPTGNLCTPGTHVEMKKQLVRRHCTNSDSDTYHGEQWVKAEVEVRGGQQIRHFINGKSVLVYQRPQLDDSDADAKKLIKKGDPLLTRGSISLQSESHPVEFRNIEIRKIDPATPIQ